MRRKGLTKAVTWILVLTLFLTGVFGLAPNTVLYVQASDGDAIPSEYLGLVDDLASDISARYLTLDGKKMSDYKVYWNKATYFQKGENFSNLTEIPQMEEYPGVFLFSTDVNKEYITVDEYATQGVTQYKYDGYFLIYEKGETEPQNYIKQLSAYEFRFQSQELSTWNFYTVSYEHNEEVEVFDLPETQIYYKGETFYPNSPYTADHSFNYGGMGNVVKAGGYALSHFAEKDGSKLVYNTEITRPYTLHPVFVNEQECVYNSDYVSKEDYIYWTYHFEEGEDYGIMDPVTVTTAEDLLNAYYDDKNTFILVNGNITISEEQQKLVSGDKENFTCLDFIIITNHSTLTFDGGKYDMRSVGQGTITVQDGGVLNLENAASLEIYFLNVQKEGIANIGEAKLYVITGYNYGTMNMKKDAYTQSSDADIEFIWNFFNAKDAEIVIDNNKVHIFASHFYYDSVQVNQVEGTSMKNHGMITVSGCGKLYINGRLDDDINKYYPFVNRGTIECKNMDYTIMNDYGRPFELRGELCNYGTISLTPPSAGSIDSFFDMVNNSSKCLADFTNNTLLKNYGTFLIGEGVGASVVLYSNGGIINYGVMGITSSKKDIALSMSSTGFVENYGELTITNTDSEKVNNIAVRGQNITNHTGGTITNNGCIGVEYGYNEVPNIPANMEGDGNIALAYWLSLYDKNSNMPEDATMLFDSEIVTCGDVFLPMNEIVDYSVTASGYQNLMGTFKTASTLEEYWSADTERSLYLKILKEGETDDDVTPVEPTPTPTSSPVDPVPTSSSSPVNPVPTSSSSPVNPTPTESSNQSDDSQQSQQADNSLTKATLKVGSKVTDKKTNAIYIVTNGKTLEYYKPIVKSKTVSIPNSVILSGSIYKVTSISENALKNNKKLQKVTIGKNIKTIGKQVFSGCNKLTTIRINSTKLTTKNVKKKAFSGIGKKAVIKVPKGKVKAYTILLKAKGASKTVKVK